MLDSEEYRELRNGKRYNTSIQRRTSENGSIEENAIGNSLEKVKEDSENQTLNKKVVNQQIKRFIASWTRQLEEFTKLVKRMVITPHPRHYPSTELGTTSATASH